MPDPLSDALSLVRARCRITGGFRAGGTWSMRFRPATSLKLDAILSGSCWLIADGREPQQLSAGDAIVLNRVGSFVLCSDPGLRPVEAATALLATGGMLDQVGVGGEVVCVGGHIETDRAGDELLLPVLPAVTRIAGGAPEAAGLGGLLERILDESTTPRPGSAFAIAEYAQLILVHVLRLAAAQRSFAQPGWLSLLGDPALRPAVALMHADPARPWGLAELAQACAMSRSTFATRFRRIAGEPPVGYLSRWRMRLAQRALRETDATIAAIAAELGYASESSFSHAFQRVVGDTPGRYRTGVQAIPGRPGLSRG